MVEDAKLVTQKVELINQKNLQNGSLPKADATRVDGSHRHPADGGSRAWIVMMGSFFCNGILFGVINSYGVLYNEFHDNLEKRNVTNASGKAGKFWNLSTKIGKGLND